VHALATRGDIARACQLVAPDHPWPAVALAAAITVDGGLWSGDGSAAAAAWRGGNPWGPKSSTLHVLGEPRAGAELIAAIARSGDRVITTPAVLTAAGVSDTYEWDLRSMTSSEWDLRRPSYAGAPVVSWLPSDATTFAEIDALLDEAFAHAAIRPGDDRAGRWCGVRNGDGALVACAAETLPAAPIAHLSALAVRPTARRQQLGGAVTRFFLAEAFGAGAPMVMLGVDADNRQASALYDRLGFATWPLAGTTLPTEVS